jgi:hypothetical protein
MPTRPPLPNEDGGAGEVLYLVLCVSTEADLDIWREEDEWFELPDSGNGFRDVSRSGISQSPLLALSKGSAEAALDMPGETGGNFDLSDLDGGFWDGFLSSWGGLGAGMGSS